jgi:hypothetical protein
VPYGLRKSRMAMAGPTSSCASITLARHMTRDVQLAHWPNWRTFSGKASHHSHLRSTWLVSTRHLWRWRKPSNPYILLHRKCNGWFTA